MKQIKGGITVVPGFEAAAAAAQIKYEGRTDMALIYSIVKRQHRQRQKYSGFRKNKCW